MIFIELPSPGEGRCLAILEMKDPVEKRSVQKFKLQWNPREVNTLEVNSRLKSTPHGDPDFFPSLFK